MEIKFTVQQVNELLTILNELPHKYARQLIDGIQAVAKPQLEAIQTNGASNPQVQADINQAEANSDSMRNE